MLMYNEPPRRRARPDWQALLPAKPINMNRVVSHYQIIERVGVGGMGAVYKTKDLKLDRMVAIKMLSEKTFAGDAASWLFDEARAAARLNHPNIATIYDLVDSGEVPFIVMEYVDGETLARRVERSVEISEAIDIAISVADALAVAHASGIAHCDIKSSNIMLTPQGAVKVLDFGLARWNWRRTDRSKDSKIGGGVSAADQPLGGKEIGELKVVDTVGIEGTTAYMSPEQAQGEAVDSRTDLFSLGIVLYEIVTGQMPFEGESKAAVLRAILSQEPMPLGRFSSDVPLELESIVRKALQKSLHERYQAAEEILSDLRRLKARLATPLSQVDRSAVSWEPADVESIPSSAVGAAFRGLLPFQEADRDRFHGRELDTSILLDRIAQRDFRFGVLFGDSGSGKTSLIRAGLAPRLWEAGYVPIYCRSYKEPAAAIAEALSGRTQIRRQDDEPYDAYLARVAKELSGTLVLICDQFEEFFTNLRSTQEREPFVSLVAACHAAPDLPVKFLLSMRSDFLYLINSEFADRVAEPLMTSRLHHLRNFDVEQAERIIEKSARRANLPFEDGLCRQVARDLAVDESVLPSELQITGDQLQRRRIFTLEEYRRAGGKEQLIYDYLENTIQASGDRVASHLLLHSLISDENTRLPLTLDEIVRRTQRSRETIRRLLRLFVDARLVREVQEEEPWRYELVHEYLIEKINRVTGRVMDATQRANRLFRQYVSNYSVDRGTRIPISKLWSIRRYSDLEKGERERELLSKSIRRGALKVVAAIVLVAAITIASAGMLSVQEDWDGIRLSDGHTAAARQAVFSPDGNRLVSVGEDGKVIVWDFARRQRIATLTDHKGWVTSAAFSPDGKWLATGGQDQSIIVWDAEGFEKAAILGDQAGPIIAVAFSPDSKFLASTAARRAMLWNVGQWQRAREIPYSSAYGNILFSHDSSRLMLSDGMIWNLRGQAEPEHAIDGGNWQALSPDGRSAVIVEGSGEVSFWDLARRKLLGRYAVHQDHGRCVALSPDGKLVASAAEDIILWDVKTQTRLAHLEHSAIVWNVTFSPDGRWLVSTHGDGAILLWDVGERDRVANFNEHSDPVRAVAFSRDGKKLASAGEDQSVIVWDVGSGRKEAVLIGHQTRATALSFSPDGSELVSADQRGALIWWSLALGQPRLTNMGPRRAGYSMAISPDGSLVATSAGVFKSSGGEQVADFDNEAPGNIYGVAFSPDGRTLASVSAYGHLMLHDTADWRQTASRDMSGAQLVSVSFSPDGGWLVTGEDEGKVRLWEVPSLRQVAVIGEHSARIKSVIFSPDGKQVASAGDDQMIALWDVQRRRLITRIGTHSAPVLALAFSPDGKRLASGEHDKSVRIYTRHSDLWGHRLH